VILNDNEMSIAPPVGAMAAYLARLLSSPMYMSLRGMGKQFAQRLPGFIKDKALRAEELARGFVVGGTLLLLDLLHGRLQLLSRCFLLLRELQIGEACSD